MRGSPKSPYFFRDPPFEPGAPTRSSTKDTKCTWRTPDQARGTYPLQHKRYQVHMEDPRTKPGAPTRSSIRDPKFYAGTPRPSQGPLLAKVPKSPSSNKGRQPPRRAPAGGKKLGAPPVRRTKCLLSRYECKHQSCKVVLLRSREHVLGQLLLCCVARGI